MPVSAYERRKFVRVDTNLDVRINQQIRAAAKKLSLGGCLIESRDPIDPTALILLEFSAHGEQFRLTGRVIHLLGPNQFGIRFDLDSEELIARLAEVIQKLQDAATTRRSTRLKIHREALLDNEPSVLTDLSEGGGSLETARVFNYGDIVELRFSLENENIHLAAQVRWKNPKGIGVEFLSPNPTQIGEIATFIIKEVSKPPDVDEDSLP